MRVAVLALSIGLVLGFCISLLFQSESTQSECPEIELVETNELALLQSENRMLLAMVKAGLAGDISGHIKTFSNLNQAEASSAPAAVLAEPDPLPSAPQLVARLQRADKKLQAQALKEGWATSERLVEERRELWQTVRRQLNDDDYMDALFQVNQPNVLIVDEIVRGSEASKQGVRPGDILWTLDGNRIITRADYNDYLTQLSPKSLVNIEFISENQQKTVMLPTRRRGFSVSGYSIKPPLGQ